MLVGRRLARQCDGAECSTQAQRDRVDRWRSGDLSDDAHRVHQAEMEVVGETKVAHALVGIAVAKDETVVVVLYRPLDEALVGRQVHDVVLVDPRRTEEQWHVVDLLGLGSVLDEFDQLVAKDNGPGRRGEVDADLEARTVGLAWPAAVVAHVVEHVLRPANQALAAGVRRLAQRGRVSVQGVGRSECVEDELGGEAGLGVFDPFELRGVKEFVEVLTTEQVLLDEQDVQRVLAVGPVAEPFVALGRLDRQRHAFAAGSRDCRPHRGVDADREASGGRTDLVGFGDQGSLGRFERPHERHGISLVGQVRQELLLRGEQLVHVRHQLIRLEGDHGLGRSESGHRGDHLGSSLEPSADERRSGILGRLDRTEQLLLELRCGVLGGPALVTHLFVILRIGAPLDTSGKLTHRALAMTGSPSILNERGATPFGSLRRWLPGMVNRPLRRKRGSFDRRRATRGAGFR